MSENSEQTSHLEKAENANSPNFSNWFRWAVGISLGISTIFILAIAAFLIIEISGQKPENLKLVVENPENTENPVENLENSTFFTEKTTKTTRKPPKICKTPECFVLATQLMTWRNSKIDPCENFYEFTCGRFVENSPAKAATSAKEESIENTLEDFIQRKEPSQSRSENELRSLFQKCQKVKTSTDSQQMLTQIMAEISKEIGKIAKFPLITKNWKEKDFDLNRALQKMAEMGIRQFGLFEVDFSNNEKMVIISADDRAQLIEKQKLKMLVGEVSDLNGLNFDKIYKEYSDTFRAIEKKIYPNGNLEKLDVIKNQVPSIDFEKIVEKYLNPAKSPQKWPELKKRVFSVENKYFSSKAPDNLETLIKTAEPRILANYIFFRLLSHFQMEAFYPIRADCAETVTGQLPRAALRVFVRNNFKKENLKIVSKMIEDIRGSYVEMFRNSTWMDDVTRQAAILKIEKMRKIVGYGEEYEPEGTLDKMYEELDTTPADSYFLATRKIEKFHVRQRIDVILSDSIFDPFSESYLEVNAGYLADSNTFSILVPFMDDPFLDPDYPKNAQIAGIGGIIGHEIGHGFDTFGINYDEQGKHRDWWTPGVKTEFKNRQKCFEKQYDEYDDPIYGKNLKGETVIDEMLADAMSTEIGWSIWKKSIIDNDDPIRLIGFEDIDPDRLYFQIKAMKYCSFQTRKPLDNVLRKPHPMDTFRVNGVLRNFGPFSEVFQCKPGSYMNSDEKCRLF